MFAETFGATGTATQFFSGQWWLVGLFILLIFVLFLYKYRVPGDSIMVFIVFGLLSVGAYELFIIQEQIIQTVLFFIFIVVGVIAYVWFSR